MLGERVSDVGLARDFDYLYFSSGNFVLDPQLADLNMPNLDGLSMLQKIREEGLEAPPIMMVTTEFDPELKKKGKEVGVSFWIVKPISEPKFLKVVETLLS